MNLPHHFYQYILRVGKQIDQTGRRVEPACREEPSLRDHERSSNLLHTKTIQMLVNIQEETI